MYLYFLVGEELADDFDVGDEKEEQLTGDLLALEDGEKVGPDELSA